MGECRGQGPADATRAGSYANVPDDVLESWQYIVNEVASRLGVPVGLIMRVSGADIEVCAATGHARNSHAVGERLGLEGSGIYCEQVLRRGEPLVVENAFTDSRSWRGNPCLERHGLMTYLGYPIRWPDGTLFGTLCVLDEREKAYGRQDRDVMGLMRDLIESNLRTLCQA
ncbi:GAF domain-containing protein [Methylobacterium nigriterrae]|uniref:GAF domain-containing protein n=1 Tax=Methylobacterium nigriterrae TaxID=3127512 RepID=UPI003013B67D